MVRLDTLVRQVLADARERMEKKAGGVEQPAKCARAEELGYPARLGNPGRGGTPLPATLRRLGKGEPRHAGQPGGQGKFRRTKL